ncbi:MAG: hypothetical protein ACRD4O_16750, partial [Bryobacteraceae bacterium]
RLLHAAAEVMKEAFGCEREDDQQSKKQRRAPERGERKSGKRGEQDHGGAEADEGAGWLRETHCEGML